jgi:hypothetical protein
MFHTRLLGEVKSKQAIVSLQFYKQVPHLHIMMKLYGFSAGVQLFAIEYGCMVQVI